MTRERQVTALGNPPDLSWRSSALMPRPERGVGQGTFSMPLAGLPRRPWFGALFYFGNAAWAKRLSDLRRKTTLAMCHHFRSRNRTGKRSLVLSVSHPSRQRSLNFYFAGCATRRLPLPYRYRSQLSERISLGYRHALEPAAGWSSLCAYSPCRTKSAANYKCRLK